MADSKASLSIDGKVVADLPILSGSAGHDVIDIRTLGSAGYFTYDPGFLATASCESSITYIDGAKGILQHRGYPIDSLAKEADYLEVCYILLTVMRQLKRNMMSLKTSSQTTPWCMKKLLTFSKVSYLMLTQWQ